MSVCLDLTELRLGEGVLLLTQIHLTQYLSLPRNPMVTFGFLFWLCPVECPRLLQTISCNFPMVKMPSRAMS